MRNSICFLLIFSLFISIKSFAQTKNTPWSVGLTLGKATYNGDIGNGFFKPSEPFHGNVGIKVGRYLTPSFDINLDGTYGRHGYYKTGVENFLANMFQMNANLAYKFNNGYILPESSKISPFVFAGLGFASFNPVDNRSTKGTDFVIPLGVGANLRLNDNWSLLWQSTYGLTNGDDVDMMMGDVTKNTMVDGNDHYMFHQIGVEYAFGGMIDSDNDGIADSKDACPNTFGIKAMDGCPDTDMDGIKDSEDACPTVFGIKTMNGCPDSDSDGIKDSEDSCPTIKGVKANNGCPEISTATQEIFRQALQGIQFETAKSVIKPSSFSILDQVVQVMNDNPAYNLTIEGHTDSSGNDEMNQKLSENRAKAVKTYLTNKGINSSRMTTIGYGETKPVASNDTAAGMAQNRRVAFKVSFN